MTAGLLKLLLSLLEPQDRQIRLAESIRNPRLAPLQPRPLPSVSTPSTRSTASRRSFQNDADGILLAWKAVVVYAQDEDAFWKAWETLMADFPDQRGYYILYP
jgi:hypothetical protein